MRSENNPVESTVADGRNAESFDQMRHDIEQRQKAILWDDARRGGNSVDEFLWKGDPQAKPVQRIGLVIFALAFLCVAIGLASIPFQKKFGDGWIIEFGMALISSLVSFRLFRNAFLRRPKRQNPGQPDGETPFPPQHLE